MITTKFVLKNLTCDSCAKIAQMQIETIAGVKNLQIVRRGEEADGELESDREINIAEMEAVLAGTHYEVVKA